MWANWLGPLYLKDQPPRSPSTLPIQLTSFIGREPDIAELGLLLRERRLVTITGTAGLGKTRLAVEAASRFVQEHPGGTWFVSLAGLADSSLVPRQVALGLGVHEQLGEPLTETLAAHVGVSRTLLLLDGCEHLLDASARLVEALLAACPGLHLLATSQQPLGTATEQVWRLAPLALPSDTAALDVLMQCEAVRLFVARALLVQPEFALTAANGAVVAQICRRLDGIPLAIELAASRTETMPVEDILDRLEDRFRLLTGGPRTVTPGHNTLRAALDWGHHLLDVPERTMFRRLAVFRADFDLPAASAASPGGHLPRDEALARLVRLVDKSLVSAHRAPSGQIRYRMLETVRQYAAERLQESGEDARMRARHADYFLALAERAQRSERRPAQSTWLERLKAEHDDLRAALEWYRGRDTDCLARLATALTWFWVMRGMLAEAREWLEGVLAARGLAPEHRARALYALARAVFWQGDIRAARVLCEESLDAYEELGDQLGAGWARILLGSICGYAGQYADGSSHLMAVVQTSADDEVRTDALMWFGELLLQQGRLAEARGALQRSLELASRREASWHAAIAVLFLSIASLMEGRHADARRQAAECLEIFRQQGNRNGLCGALDVFAALAQAARDPERALRLSGAAAAIRSEIRTPLAPRWAEVLRSLVVEPARQALGDRADAIWSEGAAMGEEEAVAYALARARPRRRRRPSGADGGPPAGALLLSRREREVAILVARGLTNRQVAGRLVIAERTVEGHLERIRTKLGIRTRTQIAVWVVERGWLTHPPRP